MRGSLSGVFMQTDVPAACSAFLNSTGHASDIRFCLERRPVLDKGTLSLENVPRRRSDLQSDPHSSKRLRKQRSGVLAASI